MHDIFTDAIAKPKRTLADYHVKQMVLSPSHWQRCDPPVKLVWNTLPFGNESLESVPQDKRGVYTFVLQPGIADHPACSYLLYVGQTEKQNFRKRYEQYLRDQRAGEVSRRQHITEMLEKWAGFLWFCYAPVEQEVLITKIEDTLLAAYLPPTNKAFPATVRRELKCLFGT